MLLFELLDSRVLLISHGVEAPTHGLLVVLALLALAAHVLVRQRAHLASRLFSQTHRYLIPPLLQMLHELGHIRPVLRNLRFYLPV